MMQKKLKRVSDEAVILEKCNIADSFYTRFKGLMGKTSMSAEEGLWIEPCNSIHTFFMRFKIDVAYLDSHGKILKIKRSLSPWRMDWIVFGARSVVEANADSFKKLSVGDVLCLS